MQCYWKEERRFAEVPTTFLLTQWHQSVTIDAEPACASRDRWTWQQSAGLGQAIVVACCNLLASLVRHRVKGLRRCMALLTASCRNLLQQLAAWSLQTGQSSSQDLHQSYGAGSIGPGPHAASLRDARQNLRGKAFEAENLHPGFKALGRVYTALADQKVRTEPSLHLRCMASATMMMLKPLVNIKRCVVLKAGGSAQGHVERRSSNVALCVSNCAG